VPAALYGRLSPAVEAPRQARIRLGPESRRRVTRLATLFAVDSVGGGFLTSALVALFFHERFNVMTAYSILRHNGVPLGGVDDLSRIAYG
jgi:hypothetical protein